MLFTIVYDTSDRYDTPGELFCAQPIDSVGVLKKFPGTVTGVTPVIDDRGDGNDTLGRLFLLPSLTVRKISQPVHQLKIRG